MLPPHSQYLANRGFDATQLAEEWGVLGTNHLGGKWAWRIIIPIHNVRGEVVSYQGRAINETTKPKYRMLENENSLEDPRELVYGLHRVPKNAVVIVEGVTGVWRIGPGTVATFGIDWDRKQAALLRRFQHRFIIFDPEPKAQQRAEELAKVLSLFPGHTELVYGFRTDPGEFPAHTVARIRQNLLNAG
jgi:DNA primase